jgi:hypothetical protein
MVPFEATFPRGSPRPVAGGKLSASPGAPARRAWKTAAGPYNLPDRRRPRTSPRESTGPWMEQTSLHPLDLDVVRAYVAMAMGSGGLDQIEGLDPNWGKQLDLMATDARRRAATGDERGANALSYGLAQALAAVQPSFFHPGVSLTAWEARIDRGIGMLMRPPSRLFVEAGLDVVSARTMPIRLDLSRGMMGGAFVPARLIPDLARLLEARLERTMRRLIDAEFDGVAVMGLVFEAANYARRHGVGLYEAIDVVLPDAPEAMPPGARVIVAERRRIDPDLRRRLEAAAKPPKKPGLLARMLGRGARSGNGRAHYPGGGAR